VSRDVLFFDLDGTLIDSAVGITQCVAHALTQMGQPVPPRTAALDRPVAAHQLRAVVQ